MESDPLKGRLLVATPVLGDPNFDHTVVLLLEHGEEGALGVVLNRPSEIDVVEPLPEWDSLTAHPSVVFVGGPVGQGAIIAVARRGAGEPESWAPVIGPIGVVDLSAGPDELSATVEELRVFHGYAGWAPGQLEGEIEEGAWFVVDAEATDVLSPRPSELWRAVLRRQKSTVAMYAHFPADPSLN